MKSKLLLGFLTLLGFTLTEIGCGREEYGSPHADFEVKGKVVDAISGDPVEGIRVTVSAGYNEMSAETNAVGEYSARDPYWWPTGGTFTVDAEDMDGEENGLYDAAMETIEVSGSDFKGGDKSWYAGKLVKTVNFALGESTPD